MGFGHSELDVGAPVQAAAQLAVGILAGVMQSRRDEFERVPLVGRWRVGVEVAREVGQRDGIHPPILASQRWSLLQWRAARLQCPYLNVVIVRMSQQLARSSGQRLDHCVVKAAGVMLGGVAFGIGERTDGSGLAGDAHEQRQFGEAGAVAFGAPMFRGGSSVTLGRCLVGGVVAVGVGQHSGDEPRAGDQCADDEQCERGDDR